VANCAATARHRSAGQAPAVTHEGCSSSARAAALQGVKLLGPGGPGGGGGFGQSGRLRGSANGYCLPACQRACVASKLEVAEGIPRRIQPSPGSASSGQGHGGESIRLEGVRPPGRGGHRVDRPRWLRAWARTASSKRDQALVSGAEYSAATVSGWKPRERDCEHAPVYAVVTFRAHARWGSGNGRPHCVTATQEPGRSLLVRQKRLSEHRGSALMARRAGAGSRAPV